MDGVDSVHQLLKKTAYDTKLLEPSTSSHFVGNGDCKLVDGFTRQILGRLCPQSVMVKLWEFMQPLRRMVLLVVRGRKADAFRDSLFLFSPKHNASIPPLSISDNVELSYLMNSKSPIIPGLNADSSQVLGVTHHLHSANVSKVYVSYGPCKSRVFKKSMLDRLSLLFTENSLVFECVAW